MPIRLGPRPSIQLDDDPYSVITQYPPTRLERAGRVLYHGARLTGKGLYWGAKGAYHGARLGYHSAKLTYHMGRAGAKGLYHLGAVASAAHRAYRQ
jgi:hypothetical protein